MFFLFFEDKEPYLYPRLSCYREAVNWSRGAPEVNNGTPLLLRERKGVLIRIHASRAASPAFSWSSNKNLYPNLQLPERRPRLPNMLYIFNL